MQSTVQTRARTGSVSVSSQGNVNNPNPVMRVRSKTGMGGSSNQLLPKPNFSLLSRKSSTVNVMEGAGPRLEYLFCIAGDLEGVTGLLRLLFESDSCFATSSFVRTIARGAKSEDHIRVSFHPLVGYGSNLWFDDEALRKSEGVIFVHSVHRDTTNEFLHWRKRIGNARAEAKVLLVAYDDASAVPDSGSVEAAAKEARVHSIKTLAGSYACLFKEVGTSPAKRMIEALAAVTLLVDELVGSSVKQQGSEASERSASQSAEIVFVGSMLTGKTALVNRLATGQHVWQYTHTTLASSHNLALQAEDREWTLKLVDTPSVCSPADVESLLPRQVVSKASAFVLVFSVRDATSFRLLGQLAPALQRACGKKLPMLVLATNTDEQVMRCVSRQEAEAFCQAAQMPFAEVSCLDDSAAAALVLGPLLKRVLEAEKMVISNPSSSPSGGGGAISDGSSSSGGGSGSVAGEALDPASKFVSEGVLFVCIDSVPAGRRTEWCRMQAELKRDLLVLTPASSASTSTAAAAAAEEERMGSTPPMAQKDERRFSGILSSMRRRSILRSKDAVPLSPTAVSSGGDGSPKGQRVVRLPPSPSGSSDQMRTVLLADAVVLPVPLNGDTNRFSFSVEDLAGKLHLFEVAEGEKRRDEWIAILKAAAKKFASDGEASPSVISSNTLGRKRGKTFNVLARGQSSNRLFE